MMAVVRTERSRRRCRRRYAAAPDLDGGRAVEKIAEQSRRALLKNLIHPLPVQDPNGEMFRRPALPFAGARRRTGWSNYEGGAAARRGKTLTRLDVFFVETDGSVI